MNMKHQLPMRSGFFFRFAIDKDSSVGEKSEEAKGT